MKHGCLDEQAMSRALAIGPSRAEQAHLDTCARCRAEWGAYRQAIELARELPAAMPRVDHVESVRTAVLASTAPSAHATNQARTRRIWIAIAISGGAAAAALAPVVLRSAHAPRPVLHAHGTLHPDGGALFETISTVPDEIVRLRDGSLDVEVEPLAPGERFRVLVGDAEVEVRGTLFTVAVERDHLRSVRVVRGKVDVRPADRPMVTLGPGQSWQASEVVAAAAPPLPAPPPVAPPPAAIDKPAPPRTALPAPRTAAVDPAPEPPRAPPQKHDDERAYDDGWDAMRRSEFAAAADAFARAAALAADPGLADDASYWQAVALSRAGRRSEAIDRFRVLLDRPDRSTHHGEASAMLGWMLVDSRQFDEARRRFDAAAGDASATARASGRAGLDALAHRH